MTIASLTSFSCPTCGAALTAADGQRQVKCPYCGNTVVVPDELRSRPRTERPAPPVIVVQQPQVVYEVIREPVRFWRPGCGCGCRSCLSSLIALTLLSVIGIGLLYAARPALINDTVAQVAGLLDSSPQIITFTVFPATVRSGQPIIARWITNGAVVELAQVGANNTIRQAINAPGSGSYQMPITGTPGQVITIRLSVSRNGATRTRQLYVTVG